MSRSAKRMRKVVREVMRTDLTAAWGFLAAVPWRGRCALAWRLARGLNMDGTKREVTR